MKPIIKILLTFFITAILLLGFSVPVNMVGNWYQQFMPNIGSQSISSITFLDSLTGFAVTQSSPINDTAYILKTINGGDNWTIKFRVVDDLGAIQFINPDTGFTCGGEIYKTTDNGENWSILPGTPNLTRIEDMYVLNDSVIWFVDDVGFGGGVFYTSNGGLNWTRQLDLGSLNPEKIYMFNARIGFISKDNMYIRKTTDGGLSWNPLINNEGYSNMYFVDSLTGWKFYTQLKKTIDGGLTWVLQSRPTGGTIFSLGIPDFSVLNTDTLLSPSGYAIYPNSQIRGVLFRTTDGGNSWKFQIPDTAIHLQSYDYIEFTDKLHGWVYQIAPTGIHTTTGGDTGWVMGIKQISNEIPKVFKLYQNYPNPFNPLTKFEVQILKSANVRIIIYDITGKIIQTVVNQKLNVGEYEISFNAKDLSSGVYFYSLIVDGTVVDTKKMMLVK